jgi:ribonuclease HII
VTLGWEPDNYAYERSLLADGVRLVAGVDEAGRSAWAGPIVVAAVILPRGFCLTGMVDSKRLKGKALLERANRIRSEATHALCWANPASIRHHGIDVCHMRLLRVVIHKLRPQPEHVLIDHYKLPGLLVAATAFDHAENTPATVAAASIIAKAKRDEMMDELHGMYLDYGFNKNRGYRTSNHVQVLKRIGPSPVHHYSKKTTQHHGIPDVRN